MKKAFILVAAIALAVIYVDYHSNDLLCEATGANYFQGSVIASWLNAKGIVCESVTGSTSPMVEGMDLAYQAFDIIGKDGNSYLMLLKKEDHGFAAVLNSDGQLLHGMIEGNMLPAFAFE